MPTVIEKLPSTLKFFNILDEKFEYAAILSGVSLMAIKLFSFDRDLTYKIKEIEENLFDHFDSNIKDLKVCLEDLKEQLSDGGLHIVEKCDKARFYTNLKSAISRSNSTVDLTNLDDHAPDHYGLQGMTKHFSSLVEVIKGKPHVQFRRICTAFETDKVYWLIHSIVETQDLGNFSVRHVSLKDIPVKMISLQIIDDNETLVVDPATGAMRIGKQIDLLWIRGRDVASSLSTYYEENWRQGTIIKEGRKINFKFLNDLVDNCAERVGDDHPIVKEMRNELTNMEVEHV